MKIKQIAALISAVMLSALCLCGCTGGSGGMEAVTNDSVSDIGLYDTDSVKSEESADTGTVTQSQEVMKNASNKIIYSGELRIETNDVSKTFNSLISVVNNAGGYVESYNESNTSSRDVPYISAAVRVPNNKFDEVMNSKSISEGNDVERSVSSRDVTLSYSDLEAELESLRIRESNLLEMLDAATNVSDMMQIDNELQNVRREIESAESNKKTLDSYINYSQIDVQITGVSYAIADTNTVTYGFRYKKAFVDMWHTFVEMVVGISIFFIEALPILLLLAAIAYLIYWLIKKYRDKKVLMITVVSYANRISLEAAKHEVEKLSVSRTYKHLQKEGLLANEIIQQAKQYAKEQIVPTKEEILNENKTESEDIKD